MLMTLVYLAENKCHKQKHRNHISASKEVVLGANTEEVSIYLSLVGRMRGKIVI